MFPTFTGSSRKQRQVNLSGQILDPFASSSWTSSATGTKDTIASAQKQRQQRQFERDKLNATKKIQRVWRGHKARLNLATEHRRQWDLLDLQYTNTITESQLLKLPEELRLLLSFFDATSIEDVARLSRTGERLLHADQSPASVLDTLKPMLGRVVVSILASFGNKQYQTSRSVPLRLLSRIVHSQPQTILRQAFSYYRALSLLLDNESIMVDCRSEYLLAVRGPLALEFDTDANDAYFLDMHKAFALVFLSTPYLIECLVSARDLADMVDIETLSHSIVYSSASIIKPVTNGECLWLLAHLIAIYQFKQHSRSNSMFIKALSLLLSACAQQLAGRVDADDSDLTRDLIETDEPATSAPLLPKYVKEQVTTLVNRESIADLLSQFTVESSEHISEPGHDSGLACYALLLLRIFPRLGEDIRSWIYLSSVRVASRGSSEIPAVKLFWQLMKNTKTFAAVVNDSKSTLSILKAGFQGTVHSSDWQIILLFLEIYAFVLRFMDDDEFLTGGSDTNADTGQRTSRLRESALALSDVEALTIFLKNMSFTMFYNTADLSGGSQEEGISSLFANSAQPAKAAKSSGLTSTESTGGDPQPSSQGFFGIGGMTFLYVRGIITRVMRMLYERDSRRQFLPKDHWLMTSRFDMEGFIPSVVAEEEKRYQVEEDGEEIEGEDDESDGNQDVIVGQNRARRLVHQANLYRQQKEHNRRHLLASIGPKLKILQNMPFTIPFETRVQIYRQFVYHDQMRRRGGTVDPDLWRMTAIQSPNRDIGKHSAKIRRDNIFEDAYTQFYKLGEGLKEPIQITFVDQFGSHEAGIDGGGVTKEFLTSVVKEAFQEPKGPLEMFVVNDRNLLYPNPSALEEFKGYMKHSSDATQIRAMTDFHRRFEFLGRIVGKCLYEGILIDVNFAGFFLLKWATHDATGAGSLANINDLRDLDKGLHQGLLKLKNYPGDVEDFSLDFTITDTGHDGEAITRELVPNGSNMSVTNENRMLYISRVARHRLHNQPYQQTQDFLRGLGEIIKPIWLSMFNQAELQTLISGDSSEIDVEDLRRNTMYSGVYEIGDDGLEHPTVQHFWTTMKSLDDADRRKVLRYVTSTPRAPLLGFSQLKPNFSIRDAGNDQQRLPSTSTCINLMKLPRYHSVEVLREKLLYAVNSGAGFDLS